MNLTLLATVVSAAAGFGVAWSLQAQQITKQELGHANERIAIQRVARQTLERVTNQLAAAQATATKRNVRVRADSDRSRNAAGGLRVATETTVRTVASDPATCNSIIAAYSAVVAASSEFIQAVARDADQCHNDLQLMQESWIKSDEPHSNK